MHSLNDVKLVGRLTRDPELRYTTGGTAVAHFRIAVSRSYKTPNSTEWKEEVAFVPCSVWRETAERVGQRLKKGSPVFVEGRLRSKEWTNKEGQKRSDLELDVLRIQFLEAIGDGGGTAEVASDESAEGGAPAAVSSASYAAPAKGKSNDDDEVPF
ncbi:MAG: single-stranded DNA-binding protein [Elusimicrobia bacterium]|nr:single-stranded DNA-binding protein [Elusimicrobiota bacterium]